jgi:hypothetical protein
MAAVSANNEVSNAGPDSYCRVLEVNAQVQGRKYLRRPQLRHRWGLLQRGLPVAKQQVYDITFLQSAHAGVLCCGSSQDHHSVKIILSSMSLTKVVITPGDHLILSPPFSMCGCGSSAVA